ncbi:MAG: IS4 family transposase [Acidobacteria bacterium]|nr:IS4 family transposase [Acidobacteriota bacterium]
MKPAPRDEWRVIQSMLPTGWREAAREQGAFRRARYIDDPGVLLRVLLFHAVNDGGLRETVAQARASEIATLSQVALLKRLRTSAKWLAWIGAGLCREFREDPKLPHGLHPRAVDSTTVQGPASTGTEWRVHYAFDLATLTCDWYELTDAHGGERLERTPMARGDVLLADRNYLRPAAVRAAAKAHAYVLLRLRWSHSAMTDVKGRRFHALSRARHIRIGHVGEWPVHLLDPNGDPIEGRVIATKLPAPLAAKAERRAVKASTKKHERADPRSLEAAHFVMVFTTVPAAILPAADVLELYRFRWQIELAFKRLKQLLKLSRLPHKDPRAAQGWILAKLVVALILETLYRTAVAISPWGYHFQRLASVAP